MKWGKLTCIDLYNCNKKHIKSRQKIEKFIKQLCKKINMKRQGPAKIKRFGQSRLKGYSAMQFLSTSSLTIHFDEEKNRAFIDIFCCKEFNKKEAERFSKNFFEAKKSKSKTFLRG